MPLPPLALMLAAVAPISSTVPATAPACPARPVLQEPWRNWSSPAQVMAGHDAAAATPALLGRAVQATLSPYPHVQYAVAPQKPPIDKSYGGLFRFSMARAARVGVALSGPAWVDVIEAGAALPAVEHGHGDACSGMRKIVWFDLKPGPHLLQIANAPTDSLRILAAEQWNPRR